MARLTGGEAIVAGAAGAWRRYALWPAGVQNDYLYNALYDAGDCDPRDPHPPRAGRRLHGAWRALSTGERRL